MKKPSKCGDMFCKVCGGNDGGSINLGSRLEETWKTSTYVGNRKIHENEHAKGVRVRRLSLNMRDVRGFWQAEVQCVSDPHRWTHVWSHDKPVTEDPLI